MAYRDTVFAMAQRLTNPVLKFIQRDAGNLGYRLRIGRYRVLYRPCGDSFYAQVEALDAKPRVVTLKKVTVVLDLTVDRIRL